MTPAARTPPDPDDALAEVVRLELSLLDPAVRRDAPSVLPLLHDEFAEVGASGTRWDGPSVAAAVADTSDEPRVEARDVEAVRLSEDVVLVTYRAHRPERVTWRSSVWVRGGERQWRLRYHQGTVAAPSQGQPRPRLDRAE